MNRHSNYSAIAEAVTQEIAKGSERDASFAVAFE
jgi:hypothetical protein